ncbi:MAG TPA: hypothetical protein VGK40_06060 [Verrucomicrobiae bacterium]
MKTLVTSTVSITLAAFCAVSSTALATAPDNIVPLPAPPTPPHIAPFDPAAAADVWPTKPQIRAVDHSLAALLLAQASAASDSFQQASSDFAGAFFQRPARSGRTLVVPASSADPRTFAMLEEDLNVMARVLDKAISSKGEHNPHKAMGIEVNSFVLGSPSPARNLYLEGYGAVFLLNVRFPLRAPPEKPEPAKDKEETSSEWEDAKSELYGPRPGEAAFGPWESVHALRGKAEEYDAQKVEDLKTDLLEALKNAAHIRQLKGDETVTLVVIGGESARPEAAVLRKNPTPGAPATGNRFYAAAGADKRKGGSGAETTLVVRVKKSDVDAFAKGKLDLDEFRKKATILIY